MSYEIYQFNLGTGGPQAYVLRGTGEHDGVTEQISYAEMVANSKDGPTLASFLDYRFKRAHHKRQFKIAVCESVAEFARGLA